MSLPEATTQYRAVFISDIHFGMRNCQAEKLLELLKRVEAPHYYLVGDIVDFWKFGNNLHWSQAQNDVIQKLLRKVRKGAEITLIPGNHDDGLRAFVGSQFGGITLQRNAIYTSANGRRYYVTHGDEFDYVIKTARWLAYLGDRGYDLALWLNNPLNYIRRKMGRDYWSLAAYLKARVKQAVNFISQFETFLADEAKKQGADGVICGHIHQVANHMMGDIHYVNCGDWVESCTAVAETYDGEFVILRASDFVSATPVMTPVVPAREPALLAS